MPLREMLENARDKFTGAMSDAERFSIGLNDRAKRLKQAMFPDEIKPGETATGTDQQGMDEAHQEMMQDMVENRRRKRR